jgi:hypothetical protein
MNVKDAMNIVIGLARGNVIGRKEAESNELQEIRNEQLTALDIISEYFSNPSLTEEKLVDSLVFQVYDFYTREKLGDTFDIFQWVYFNGCVLHHLEDNIWYVTQG